MTIIKLNAIDSTNTYLKNLCVAQFVDNFTIVITENQTNGKGQMGAVWETQIGKNLTFSILIKDLLISLHEIFNLNILVSISVFEALQELKIPDLSIKWANDILSDKKKIAGILIENVIKSDKEILSVVGIGLNVNQENFDNLPQASSLKNITQTEWNKDLVLKKIVNRLQSNYNLYKSNGEAILWKKYHQNLFKINVPMAFEDKNNTKFMGIIKQVLPNGLLQIETEDELLKNFDLKEIKMLY
jgi:BirA family transcriptional regulator, biotin operon repressor / biotin---[acetyl-CoA-carboxylase] ligase